jgi:hypothetical protein
MMAAETQATADPVVAELARIRDRAEDEMRHVDRAPGWPRAGDGRCRSW